MEATTLVVDPGTREWRYGWGFDAGPVEILPCEPADQSHDAWRKRLQEVFTTLDAVSSEYRLLFSERPGMPEDERKGMASTLFFEVSHNHEHEFSSTYSLA